MWGRRKRMLQQLSTDIEAYLEAETRDNIERGMTADEARYAARRKFGNVELVKEQTRDVWTARAWEQLLQDIRYACRTFRRNPGFTVVAVLTLAIGIGATSAVFSVVNAVLLQPPPFRDPDRLVQLLETERAPGEYPLNSADYLDWQAQNHTFSSSSLYSFPAQASVTGSGEPERGLVIVAQANFFNVLGVKPLLGRTFARGEDAGKHRVAVLSYAFWQRHFGGQRDIVSKRIRLDGEAYQIVGIMPSSFRFPFGNDIWRPLDLRDPELTHRGDHGWQGIARIKSGVELAQARQDLLTISKRLEKEHPDGNTKVYSILIPIEQVLIGNSRSPLLILLGSVLMVLLIACANVANLLLARGAKREREVALRASLGAGRLRLLRQLLTESILLALMGAGLGLAGALYSVRLLDMSVALPIPHTNPLAIDRRVLLFTLIVSMLTAVLFSIAPAFQMRDSQLSERLKNGAQSALGLSRTGFLRSGLIVSELALTLSLLLGAVLLLRSFVHLRNAEIGIDAHHLITASVALPESSYQDFRARRAFFDALLNRVQGMPDVESVALSSEIPLEGGTNGYINFSGAGKPSTASRLVGFNYVSPSYFRTLGIPLLRGRDLNEADMEQAAAVVQRLLDLYKAAPNSFKVPPGLTMSGVISRQTARTFWPDSDPLGKSFSWNGVSVNVVGVVGDVREYGLRADPVPQAYYPSPFNVGWSYSGTLTVKTREAPQQAITALRAQLRSLNPNLALFRPRTMEQVMANEADGTRFQTLVLGSFAAFALILAAVGLYGVMSYAVAQRTREIGIRMAVGAEQFDVLRLVLRQGVGLTLLGLVLGSFAAFALARSLGSLLYGVRPFDPATFIAVALLLSAVAVAAFYIPSRRASRIDPIVALRYE